MRGEQQRRRRPPLARPRRKRPCSSSISARSYGISSASASSKAAEASAGRPRATCSRPRTHASRAAMSGDPRSSATHASAASSSPVSSNAAASRCCHGTYAGSSTPSPRGMARSGASASRTSAGRPRAAASDADRERRHGDVALDPGQVLARCAHMPLGHSPVAARAGNVRGGPVRLRDHPAVLGFDRERDRALRRDHGVVPRALEIVEAGDSGERHRGDDEQALVKAGARRSLECFAGGGQVAVSDPQVGLEREQHEAAARRRRTGIVEPAIQRSVRVRPTAGVAQAVRQRGGREQAGGRVVGARSDGPAGPIRLTRRCAGGRWRGTRGAERPSPTGARRGRAPGAPTRARAGAGPARGRRRRSPGTPRTLSRREPGETSVCSRVARRGAVARVHQRLDRLQGEALALGLLRAQAAGREEVRHRARPRAARHLVVGERLEIREQGIVGDRRRLDAVAHRGHRVLDEAGRGRVQLGAPRRREPIVDRRTRERVRELDQPPVPERPVASASSSVSSGPARGPARSPAERARRASPPPRAGGRPRAGSARAGAGSAARTSAAREAGAARGASGPHRAPRGAPPARAADCPRCARGAGARPAASSAPRGAPSAETCSRVNGPSVTDGASLTQPSGRPSSRTARRISTGLCASRRAANSSARSESASARWASSTTTTHPWSPAPTSSPPGAPCPRLHAARPRSRCRRTSGAAGPRARTARETPTRRRSRAAAEALRARSGNARPARSSRCRPRPRPRPCARPRDGRLERRAQRRELLLPPDEDVMHEAKASRENATRDFP